IGAGKFKLKHCRRLTPFHPWCNGRNRTVPSCARRLLPRGPFHVRTRRRPCPSHWSLLMIEVEDARVRGRRFAAARVARGLTQRELARRVGSTQSVITQIERGVIARSKFDALIMLELGLPVDPETERFILAARAARDRAMGATALPAGTDVARVDA